MNAPVGSKWNHPTLAYLTVRAEDPVTIEELQALGYESDKASFLPTLRTLSRPKAKQGKGIEHPTKFTIKANAGLLEQASQEALKRLSQPHNPTERLVFRATVLLLDSARQEPQECYDVTDASKIPRNVALATLNVLKAQGLLGYDP